MHFAQVFCIGYTLFTVGVCIFARYYIPKSLQQEYDELVEFKIKDNILSEDKKTIDEIKESAINEMTYRYPKMHLEYFLKY